MYCINQTENDIKTPFAEKFAWFMPWRYLYAIKKDGLTPTDLYNNMSYKLGEDWKVKIVIGKFFSFGMSKIHKGFCSVSVCV